MALSEIEKYKFGLKKYLENYYKEVQMIRGQTTTTFIFYEDQTLVKLEIKNTTIESCYKSNKLPDEIKNQI